MTMREHRTWWLILAALALATVFACRWAAAAGPSSEPQTVNPTVKKLELAAYHAWNAAEDAWLKYAEACEAYRKGSIWSPSEYLWRQVERAYGGYVDARMKFYRLQGRWLKAKHRAGEL